MVGRKSDDWFFRQMYKTLATYSDEEVVEQMMKSKAHRDQLQITTLFEITTSEDGVYKEVWAKSPKVNIDDSTL